MRERNIKVIAVIAIVGSSVGVLADLFSAWSSQGHMGNAFMVDLEIMHGIFADKPRWSYVVGNFLGVFFIPLHAFGFYLVYRAIKPVQEMWATIILFSGAYLAMIGAGFHGTLAFVGDMVKFGDDELVTSMGDYWYPWAYAMFVGYIVVGVLIGVIIVTKNSLYPRWAVLVSPIGIVVISSVVILLLPESLDTVATFLSLTGLNLPLLIFYVATYRLLSAKNAMEQAV